MCHPHLLTILYVNQQLINQQGPQNLGTAERKGNGGSPDPFVLRKKGLARETRLCLLMKPSGA